MSGLPVTNINLQRSVSDSNTTKKNVGYPPMDSPKDRQAKCKRQRHPEFSILETSIKFTLPKLNPALVGLQRSPNVPKNEENRKTERGGAGVKILSVII